MLNKLSDALGEFRVIKIDHKNIKDVYKLCKENKFYYECLQEKVSKRGVKGIINELPPDCEQKNKYFVGIYRGDNLVAILDLIDGYPNNETIFIGLLMVAKSAQGEGVGSNIITKLLSFFKTNNYKVCRLGVIEKNIPAINFWIKQKFNYTGEKYNHEKYNVIMMSNKL